jgi:hypothetical protein
VEKEQSVIEIKQKKLHNIELKKNEDIAKRQEKKFKIEQEKFERIKM